MTDKYKWKTRREIDDEEGSSYEVVDIEEALKVVEWWRTATLCEKPRGSCLKCDVVNCYYKSKGPVLSSK